MISARILRWLVSSYKLSYVYTNRITNSYLCCYSLSSHRLNGHFISFNCDFTKDNDWLHWTNSIAIINKHSTSCEIHLFIRIFPSARCDYLSSANAVNSGMNVFEYLEVRSKVVIVKHSLILWTCRYQTEILFIYLFSLVHVLVFVTWRLWLNFSQSFLRGGENFTSSVEIDPLCVSTCCSQLRYFVIWWKSSVKIMNES